MGDTRYELSVPYGTRVVARSTSGDITVRDVRAEVDARTTSGEVVVDAASGRVTVESMSGGVRLSRLQGAARVETVSAEVDIRDASGEVEVETVSGEISLRDVRARSVRAETTSGEVEFFGSIDSAGRYDFSSHSGDVRLSLPADAGAEVSVQTFSGSLDSDFPLTLQPTDRNRPGGHGQRMTFTLGRGGARIHAETFSGSVILARGSRER
jgi:DUF4097 and DUF4098 domain-containing protein YvlB